MATCPRCKRVGCWVGTDLKPVCNCRNTVPPITHPLGRGWEQPNTARIAIDDTHALMDDQTFCSLSEYSCSYPSGVYEGKMWKSKVQGRWYLRWYGHSEKPDCCSNNQREIILA